MTVITVDLVSSVSSYLLLIRFVLGGGTNYEASLDLVRAHCLP